MDLILFETYNNFGSVIIYLILDGDTNGLFG